MFLGWALACPTHERVFVAAPPKALSFCCLSPWRGTASHYGWFRALTAAADYLKIASSVGGPDQDSSRVWGGGLVCPGRHSPPQTHNCSLTPTTPACERAGRSHHSRLVRQEAVAEVGLPEVQSWITESRTFCGHRTYHYLGKTRAAPPSKPAVREEARLLGRAFACRACVTPQGSLFSWAPQAGQDHPGQ